MNTYYLLLIEATLVWLVLLLFYALAFRGNRQWAAHRRFLLFALALGAVLPLLPSVQLGGSVAAARLPADLLSFVVPAGVGEASAAPATVATFGWPEVLLVIYGMGFLVGIGVAVYRLALLLRPVAQKEERHHGFRVVRSSSVRSPYAAFGTIYLPARLDPELECAALLHEAAHLRAGHPYERLAVLLVCLLLWFHPLPWLYARLLARVQEFEADAAVIGRLPIRDYGRQLLRATQAPSLVPALFSSPIKERITMLIQSNNTRRFRAAHWTVLLLLLASLFVACAGDAVTDELAPIGEAKVFNLEMLQHDENAPKPTNAEYPTFLHGIYSTIRYPEQDRNGGVVGTVAVEVSLSSEGEITAVKTELAGREGRAEVEDLVVTGYADRGAAADFAEVVADDAHGLHEEVDRAIREIGKFKPATENGVAIPSTLIFDVKFNLEN